MKDKMIKVNLQINLFFEKFRYLGFWILRLLLGIDFLIRGYQKFPIPSNLLHQRFELSLTLATLLPFVQVLLGLMIIVAGFFDSYVGNLLTRFSALGISIYMVFVFMIAHKPLMLSINLFTSEQIFLLGLGVFFLFRGKD